MPSDKPARRLEDIIENAQAIHRYVAGNEYDAIREDRLWDIVQIDLPPLCAAREDALRRLRAGQAGQ